MFFAPTKTLAEWNAFAARPPANIAIYECVEVCSAGNFDDYTFPIGYDNQTDTKTKVIPNGSCTREFQCNTTLDEWTPSSPPNCVCTTGTWNGSACVEANQTKTMSCNGTPPTNATITGPTTYTATTTDGGVTWSPGILEYTPANIEKGVEIINNPT